MANEMSKAQQARVDKMVDGYKDRIARQIQSIDRLLAERDVLQANLRERSERVRELEATLENIQGQKEEEKMTDLPNEQAEPNEKVTGEEAVENPAEEHVPATQVVDDDDDVELSDNQEPKVDDKE